MLIDKNITASIVVYNEDPIELENVINSFLGSPFSNKIYIIDNSPTNWLEEKIIGDNIEYVFSGSNIGFGRGHNSILDTIEQLSDYHLILNPDVFFQSEILEKLINQLEKDTQLSMVAPKVSYPSKELQYTARKFPTIIELLCRFLGVFKHYTDNKEYKNDNLLFSFFPDFVQGSFMLFKTKDFIDLKGFDQRYFMYMEDVDICRRIDLSGKKKLYFPKVEVTHTHRKGSSKNIRLFFIHMSSIIKYFMKWGFKST
tara:strand:+ start:1286 stop:2053 length:768 start_codon:yes stop_codon:yes gene_type:complete